ncbi:MAG: hypothetical protein ACI9XR_000092 [Flavobacterium sp.]
MSNTNTTFATGGSGKTSFSAITNFSGSNIIDVVATRLLFGTQPSSTGVNSAMSSNLTVLAVDNCGNLDKIIPIQLVLSALVRYLIHLLM